MLISKAFITKNLTMTMMMILMTTIGAGVMEKASHEAVTNRSKTLLEKVAAELGANATKKKRAINGVIETVKAKSGPVLRTKIRN